MKNVVVLDNPLKVDAIEWAFAHPGCHALCIREERYKKTIKIKAYALNEQGNAELNKLPFAYDSDIEHFGGIGESMVNYMDVLRAEPIEEKK